VEPPVEPHGEHARPGEAPPRTARGADREERKGRCEEIGKQLRFADPEGEEQREGPQDNVGRGFLILRKEPSQYERCGDRSQSNNHADERAHSRVEIPRRADEPHVEEDLLVE